MAGLGGQTLILVTRKDEMLILDEFSGAWLEIKPAWCELSLDKPTQALNGTVKPVNPWSNAVRTDGGAGRKPVLTR